MPALSRAEVKLQNEYARSEALVTTMMPASIATRLKFMPDQRIADRIECLTILFADLVGFTKAAHDLPPDEVPPVRRAVGRDHGVIDLRALQHALRQQYLAAPAPQRQTAPSPRGVDQSRTHRPVRRAS